MTRYFGTYLGYSFAHVEGIFLYMFIAGRPKVGHKKCSVKENTLYMYQNTLYMHHKHRVNVPNIRLWYVWQVGKRFVYKKYPRPTPLELTKLAVPRYEREV